MVYIDEKLKKKLDEEGVDHIDVLVTFGGNYKALGTISMAVNKNQLSKLERQEGIEAIELDDIVGIYDEE